MDLKEVVFRHRDKIAAAIFLGILACLAATGKTLGLGEPAEDWLDALGCLIVIAGHGLRVLALRHIGPRSRTHQFDAPQLVRDGPYAVVRNPLYLGNWLIAVGLCVIAQLWWLLAVGPVVSFLLYYACALAEEENLSTQFGEEYERYRRTTPRFVPRSLMGRRGWRTLFTPGGRWPALLRTKEYQAVLTSLGCVMLLELLEHLQQTAGLH